MSDSCRQLFIFVEGDDDQRFFDTVIKPQLEGVYEDVQTVTYSQDSPKNVRAYLRSIQSMGATYLFVGDIDGHPCVTSKKKALQKKYGGLDAGNIAVVAREIEGWYLAGLSKSETKRLRIEHSGATDDIQKENFNRIIAGTPDLRIRAMIEILNAFSICVAKSRNKSFKYFYEKHIDKS